MKKALRLVLVLESLLLGVVYTAFLVPFMYLMDRTMYRTYLRRTGQRPPPKRTNRS